MTLEDYIDMVKTGKQVPKLQHGGHWENGKYWPSSDCLGIGYGRGIYTSGTLSLHFRGKIVRQRQVASRFQRQAAMESMLREISNLSGEKYFTWSPNQL